MLLITELQEQVNCVIEEGTAGKKPNLFIEGTFMVYGKPNGNNRRYSKPVMEREVNRYMKESVSTKRAFGELNHPSGPTINLDRVSHLIESLKMNDDGTVWGRAKILDTPMGNIVRGILEGDGCVGVSTRGLGSLKEATDGIMEVQDDFRLVTAGDVVADPSAPGAFVKGIMENVNWYFDESVGSWLPEKAEKLQKQMKKLSTKQIEEQRLAFFSEFLKTL